MPKKPAKSPRPKRPAIRLGLTNPGALVQRLRELHRLGEDPALERFPDDEELYQVLQHAERQARTLLQPRGGEVDVLTESAVIRSTLWQHLRERADAGQLKAIEDGRAAGAEWDAFMEGLCVVSRQGAYQKARRLAAEQIREPGERRSPEVMSRYEKRAAAEMKAERTRTAAQDRRFPLAQETARLLLKHRDDLLLGEWGDYWLTEIEETIDTRETASERARFAGWVESCVRAIRMHATEEGKPPATSEDAATAFEHARRFVQS